MEIDPLSTEEIDDFINACDDESDKLIALLGIYAGLRAGEIAHIRKDWVRFQEQAIRIPPEQPCSCGPCKKEGIWKPKTKRSSRTVHVKDPALMTILKKYFTLYDKNQITSRQGVSNRVRKIANDAGIVRKVTAHSLRHTFGTILARKRMSINTIMAEMGHSRPDTALIYVHFVGRDAEREMEEKW
jgi:integrase/recombinase XerD